MEKIKLIKGKKTSKELDEVLKGINKDIEDVKLNINYDYKSFKI